MSQPTDNHDDLDPRLRDYYARNLPTPPTPGALWQQVAAALHTEGELTMSATPDVPTISTPPQTRAAQRQPRRIISGLSAVAAMVVLGILTYTIFAAHVGSRLTTTPSSTQPILSQPGFQNILNSVSMVSPTDGWAVGQSGDARKSGTYPITPLLLHYTEDIWQPVTLQLGLSPDCQTQLDGVSMVNARDGWAVGGTNCPTGSALLLHYDGTAWTRVASSISSEVIQVQMLAADDGWAITGSGVIGFSIIHFQHGIWQTVPVPSPGNNAFLTHFTMLSANEGWAVGALSQSGPSPYTGFVLRYNGEAWTVQHTFANTQLLNITMLSSTEGWASGAHDKLQTEQGMPVNTSQPALYHFHAGQWSDAINTLVGAHDQTNAMLLTSATTGWMTRYTDYPGVAALYRFDGHTWQVFDVPLKKVWYGDIHTFDLLPNGEIWAVGDAYQRSNDATPFNPLIMHYVNGQWSVIAD